MNYYNEIKRKLIENEGYKRVKDYSKNKHEINSYFNVGKLIVEAQGGEKRAKYGNGLIREYSKRLIEEIDIRYGERSLRDMSQFYLVFKNQIWQTVSTKLSWSHYRIIYELCR